MTTTANTPRLLDARTVADLCGVNVETIRRAAAEGALPSVRLRPRGNLKFRIGDVERLIGSGHVDGGPLRGAVEPSEAALDASSPEALASEWPSAGGGTGTREEAP